MLGRIVRDILWPNRDARVAETSRFRVLNVGGGSKTIPIPPYYGDWEHVLLDVDPRNAPDIVCDARNLRSLAASQFDAVYCRHNLEHYYRHDAVNVLRGFRHVLKPEGFTEIIVPDLQSVIEHVLAARMDLGDVLYESTMGPIAALDVIYGLGREIEESSKDYYAHKTGFTPKLMQQTLERCGFAAVFIFADPDAFEVRALAFKSEPTARHGELLGLAAA